MYLLTQCTETGQCCARTLHACRYEDKLKGEGKSRDDIRPPRFKESGNPDYPAGSKTIVCELCPMKRGIFKQAAVEGADGEKRWAHVVCALWQTPDVQVAHVNRVDVVRLQFLAGLLAFLNHKKHL